MERKNSLINTIDLRILNPSPGNLVLLVAHNHYLADVPRILGVYDKFSDSNDVPLGSHEKRISVLRQAGLLPEYMVDLKDPMVVYEDLALGKSAVPQIHDLNQIYPYGNVYEFVTQAVYAGIEDIVSVLESDEGTKAFASFLKAKISLDYQY